jgi:4-hydroxy-tetrahydrodipicolinate synthase
MISAAAVGATGLLSPLASIAPKLIGHLYELCMAEKFTEARPAQEQAAILYRALRDAGVAGFKTGMRVMGRDCGAPRPPLAVLTEADSKVLLAELTAAGTMNSEPRGWV